PGPTSSDPYGLISSGGRLYFSIAGATSDLYVWDGTSAPVDLVPNGFYGTLTTFQGATVFSSNATLYRHDGAGAPTVATSFTSSVSRLLVSGALLFASGQNGVGLFAW